MWCNFCNNNTDVCAFCKRNTDLLQPIISLGSYHKNRFEEPLPMYPVDVYDDTNYWEDKYEQELDNQDPYDQERFRLHGCECSPENPKVYWLIIISIILSVIMGYIIL